MTAVAHVPGRRSSHFGMRPRPPKPYVLMIVFGLFLVIVGVTATALTAVVSLHVSTASLNATLSSDAATVRTFVNSLLGPDDFSGKTTQSRVALLESGLQSVAERGEILRIEVLDPSGVILLSNEATVRGGQAPLTEALGRALAGDVEASVLDPGAVSEALGPPLAADHLIREYFPLIEEDGTVRGVVGIWRDAGPLLIAVDQVRGDVVLLTLSAAAVVALLLFAIFRAAQQRITRQTEQLVESTRLDALTGLLNHGTLVSELALSIEALRGHGVVISVALVDLDNFRLVNDTYGHDAGDTALRQLAAKLKANLPDGSLVGRYGPDEFLVVARDVEASALEAIVHELRSGLVQERLEIDSSESLPLTVSAGIAAFPEHADSVTALLSSVAVVLAEARASGGDAVRVAGGLPETAVEAGSFDVLQGLVFAVDTKDRYTRRHSEDVSRYAVFLAGLLDVDADLLETIRMTGLLHDVGKIGIPDALLRKPSRLTAQEQDVVKQHVALGDAIVRNVENLDLVRAGIRHHHERWDGRGYLDALAGEDIPFVARILAVADAFSAMTTTRPYRKALSVEEALRRLGDAAGSQLDERLVTLFIHGLETVPDAPLPGIEDATHLWVPRLQVA